MVMSICQEKAKEMISQNKAVLIDVREPLEYAQGYIEGAIHLPMSTYSPSSYQAVLAKKKTDLIIYCRSGVRSAQVCATLEKEALGAKIYNLECGVLSWKGVLSSVTSP